MKSKVILVLFLTGCVFYTGASWGKTQQVKRTEYYKKSWVGEARSSVIDRTVELAFDYLGR